MLHKQLLFDMAKQASYCAPVQAVEVAGGATVVVVVVVVVAKITVS